jgi:hypothetical protein
MSGSYGTIDSVRGRASFGAERTTARPAFYVRFPPVAADQGSNGNVGLRRGKRGEWPAGREIAVV